MVFSKNTKRIFHFQELVCRWFTRIWSPKAKDHHVLVLFRGSD